MHNFQMLQLPLNQNPPLLPNQFKLNRLHKTSQTPTHNPIPSTITQNSSPKLPLYHKATTKTPTHHFLPPSQSQTKLWNSKIKLLFQNQHYQNCLSLYHQMLNEQIPPNPTTFAYVLKACSSLSDLRSLRLLHNDMLYFKLESNLSIAAALLHGYFQCGFPEMAHRLFGKMPHRDIVCWTIIISQSNESGEHEKAIGYFGAMLDERIFPDEVALVSILSAITRYGSLRLGTEVHGYLIRKCVKPCKAIISSLVNTYAKLGKMDYAARVLSHSDEKNVVAWTALMAGLLKMCDSHGVLMLYWKMVNLGIQPTKKTVTCALSAIRQLGFLRFGTQVHGSLIKMRIELDEYTLSSLIDMYANCGAPTYLCRRLFDGTATRDVVLWTSMILAHGRRGEGPASLQLFDDMRAAGVKPDSVVFTAVLSACCSSGLLHEGLKCFESMIVEYGIKAREEHYGCLTGLIAKDGRLAEAYESIESMDLRNNGRIWEIFLVACRVHGNVHYGEIAASKLLEIDPGNSSAYSDLSRIYSAVGRGNDADILMIGDSSCKFQEFRAFVVSQSRGALQQKWAAQTCGVSLLCGR